MGDVIARSLARSISGKDKPNSTLWLATRTGLGKITLSCPRGITRCLLGQDGCRDIGLVLVLRKHTKKNLANIEPSWPHTWSIAYIYFMASSLSRQDESNPELPERARWSYLARSGLPAVPRNNFPESHIKNSLLTKLVPSRWLDIGVVLFLGVNGPRLRLGP